jgi:hypothetical protein
MSSPPPNQSGRGGFKISVVLFLAYVGAFVLLDSRLILLAIIIPVAYIWRILQERPKGPSVITTPTTEMSAETMRRMFQSSFGTLSSSPPGPTTPLDFSSLALDDVRGVVLTNAHSLFRSRDCQTHLVLQRGQNNLAQHLLVKPGRPVSSATATYSLQPHESLRLRRLSLRGAATAAIEGLDCLAPQQQLQVELVDPGCMLALDKLEIGQVHLRVGHMACLILGPRAKICALYVNSATRPISVQGPVMLTVDASGQFFAIQRQQQQQRQISPQFPTFLPLSGIMIPAIPIMAISSNPPSSSSTERRMSVEDDDDHNNRGTRTLHPIVLRDLRQTPPIPMDEANQCTACQSAGCNTFNLPCSHRTYCAECAPEAFKNLPNCSICRAPVEGIDACKFPPRKNSASAMDTEK